MLEKNNIALIVGGFNGFGMAIAKRLFHQGTTALLCGQDAGQLAAMNQVISSLPGLVGLIIADLDRAEEVERMVNDIVTTYGRIDQLIINVMMVPPGSILNTNHIDIRRAVNANTIQTYTLCQQVAKEMVRDNTGGSIVLVCDGLTDGEGKIHESSIECDMCCGAIERMTRTLAADLGAHQIRVNSVRGETQKPHQTVPQIRLDRIAELDAVAGAVSFLASKNSSHITGVSMPVSEGLEAYDACCI